MVAVPEAPAAGVKVSVPLGEIAGPAVNRAGLLLLTTWKVTACPPSLAGPALIAVAHAGNVCGPAAEDTVRLGPATKAGASFTAFTVRLTVTVFPSTVPSFTLYRNES